MRKIIIISKVFREVFLGSLLGFVSSCKHPESCSEYFLRQLKEHGTITGLFRGGKRVLRCWGTT